MDLELNTLQLTVKDGVADLRADFTLETLTLDSPRAGEVLVKIAAVGLCHTDLATREGIVPIPIPMPAVLGHEGAAELTPRRLRH